MNVTAPHRRRSTAAAGVLSRPGYVFLFGKRTNIPFTALLTATLNAADLMGWPDCVDTLEGSRWADVIAVQGDPLHDVRVLQHVSFVMKGGVIYQDETQPDKVPRPAMAAKASSPAAAQASF